MTPFFSRGMSGIAQCCAILALTNRKPIEEKEKPMKRYIVERTVNDEPTGINWEFDTREEALAFFKQAAEDLPREWKTEKQSSCTPLTDTWAYELSACPDGDPDDWAAWDTLEVAEWGPGDYEVECHLASIDDQIRMDDAGQAVKDAAREEVKRAMASVDGETAVELAEVIDEHAYYLTAAQIRDALHESAEKIGAMPAVSPSKVADIVDHLLSEKEEED